MPDQVNEREEEINERRAVLESEINERREEYKALARELDDIATQRSVTEQFNRLSSAARKKLQMIANTGGIETEESVKGLVS